MRGPPKFVGLDKLAYNGSTIQWEDFDEIVNFFDNLSKDKAVTIVAYKGLGTYFVQTFKDKPEWTPSDCQRYVGKKLALALNGMLKEKARHDEGDIFKPSAELRKMGRSCIGQHVLESGHACRLPDDLKVSVGHARYPNIILGKWKGPERHGLIEIKAHRLACWLMHGNPEARTNEKDTVVTHACVRNPGCVRLACLQWESQRSNIQGSYAPNKRRQSW